MWQDRELLVGPFSHLHSTLRTVCTYTIKQSSSSSDGYRHKFVVHCFAFLSFRALFATLRKATISFVMCLSVHLPGWPRIPLKKILWNLIYVCISKNLSIIFKIHYNLASITGTSQEHLCTFMIILRLILLRMRNILDKFVEKNKTYFMFNSLYCFQKLSPL